MARRFDFGKGAASEQSVPVHSLGVLERGGPANPTAAHHNISIVKNRGLPGCDCSLRFVQLDTSAPPRERRKTGAGSRMAITYLSGDLDRFIGAAAAAPVNL